mgnify:CR=1 FL=1
MQRLDERTAPEKSRERGQEKRPAESGVALPERYSPIERDQENRDENERQIDHKDRPTHEERGEKPEFNVAILK